MRIQKVGVLSLGKIIGAIYAAAVFVVGAIVAIIAIGGYAVSMFSGAGNTLGQQELLLVAILAVLGGPVVYGAAGFATGVVVGFAYNVVAERFGGLEIDFDQWSQVTRSQ